MIVYSRVRTADRAWPREFDELDALGFVWRSDSDGSRLDASVCNQCGEDMEVRIFEFRDVSYRAYALCACAVGG